VTDAVSSNVVETAYTYKYDNIGIVTNYVLETDAYVTTNNYAFDVGNRLTNMTLTAWERQAPAWQNMQNISYSYNSTNGLASSWTNSASGIFCSYKYDIMDRPVSLEWKATDGSTIKSYDYMYSNADMITNVVDNTGNVTKYEYDTLSRLTKETVGDNITAYSYDLAGNRIAKVSAVIEGDVVRTDGYVNYTLGLGNRLASWGDNGEAHYNLAGCLMNMVSDVDGKELNFGWNSKYQLESVKLEGGSEKELNYQYNVLGQRVARSEVVAGVTNTEYYVHDGVNIVADLDAGKSLIRSYKYAPGYDNIISMTTYGDSETNTYFYIRNHNNSVVALVDEAGNVAESYEYDAYGAVTVFDGNGNELDESALGNRYTFQGREIDWSTGLYNFRARWYSSETGRWLSKDPIGINGGLNQYVFCGNNPVMFRDPEGTADILMVVMFRWQQSHYKRNEHQEGKVPLTEDEAKSQGWRKLPVGKSVFHMINAPENVKYISPNGHYEGVYDRYGNLDTSIINGGTFNYASPDKKIAHTFKDVLPYYLFGSGEEDKFMFKERIEATIVGAIIGSGDENDEKNK
jgi:RHS repeat-associated protein